jgi:hypothetical protein
VENWAWGVIGNAAGLIAMFAFIYKVLNGKADKPSGAVVAQEAEARRQRDKDMFDGLRRIEENTTQTKIEVVKLGGKFDVLETRVKSVEKTLEEWTDD